MSIAEILEYLTTIGTLYPSISFFVTILAAGWLGNTIITQYLMQKKIQDKISRIAFLVTFSCSLSLLSMYLFQIMSFKISHNYWYLVLIVLLGTCEIVIPLCLIFRLPFADYFTPFKVPILGVLLSFIYLYFFGRKVLSTQQQLNLQSLHLKIFIEMIIEYGVYLMALMSAYGAVWFPYVLYNIINQKQRHKILHAKKKMEDQIHFIIQQIKSHKYQILQIKQQRQSLKSEIEANKTNISTVAKLLSFVKGSGKNDERQKQLEKLEEEHIGHINELQTLKRVHEQSFLHYCDILEEERRHTVSETFFGKFMHKFSFILAGYSLSRIFLTILNTIRGRKKSADPITRLINFLQQDMRLDLGSTFQQFTQYISFILMGYIMITSVRAFSMNFKAFIDYILRRKRLNNILDSTTQIYLFSLVYGIYFLAAVILQQSGLPRAYTSTFQHMTGNIDIIKHFVLFDHLFLGMCLISGCLVTFTIFQRKGKLNFIIRQHNIIDWPDQK